MFGVHPTQVGGWKKQALTGLPEVFTNGGEQLRQQVEAEKDELYKQIGQLKVELDFLIKELGSSGEQRRLRIDPEHPDLSVQRQCELLGLPRSTYYYQARLERGKLATPAPPGRTRPGAPLLRQRPQGLYARRES